MKGNRMEESRGDSDMQSGGKGRLLEMVALEVNWGQTSRVGPSRPRDRMGENARLSFRSTVPAMGVGGQ